MCNNDATSFNFLIINILICKKLNRGYTEVNIHIAGCYEL